MHNYNLKHQQAIPVPLEREPQTKEISVSEAERSYRLNQLRWCNLDPFEVEIVSLLERPIVLTPTELEYLVGIEKCYGIAPG